MADWKRRSAGSLARRRRNIQRCRRSSKSNQLSEGKTLSKQSLLIRPPPSESAINPPPHPSPASGARPFFPHFLIETNPRANVRRGLPAAFPAQVRQHRRRLECTRGPLPGLAAAQRAAFIGGGYGRAAHLTSLQKAVLTLTRIPGKLPVLIWLCGEDSGIAPGLGMFDFDSLRSLRLGVSGSLSREEAPPPAHSPATVCKLTRWQFFGVVLCVTCADHPNT